MKKILIIMAVFFIFSLLTAQVVPEEKALTVTGYAAAEYAQGQPESGLDDGTFRNVEAGLVLAGLAASKISYLVEFRLIQGKKEQLERAWALFGFSDSVRLKLGLYLVPFGKYNTANKPHQTPLIQPPLMAAHFFPASWRDVGVQTEGSFSGLFYSAYIGNGLAEKESLTEGQQFKDNNKDKGWGVRAGFNIGEDFEGAYSHYQCNTDDDNSRGIRFRGADLSWMTGGVHILAEYMWADVGKPEGFSDAKGKGYYVQVTYSNKSFRPVVSYQWMEYEDELKKSRWTLGAVYMLGGKMFLKFEYDFNSNEPRQNDDAFFIQMAVSF